MLPEWERHAECVMAWCAAHDHYSHREIGKIRDEQALIAKAISAFEPVTMLVNPGDRKAAAARCGPSVRTEILEHYDTWTRDTLPVFGKTSSGRHTAIVGCRRPLHGGPAVLLLRRRFLGVDVLDDLFVAQEEEAVREAAVDVEAAACLLVEALE